LKLYKKMFRSSVKFFLPTILKVFLLGKVVSNPVTATTIVSTIGLTPAACLLAFFVLGGSDLLFVFL
jgi:hypothetical protein